MDKFTVYDVATGRIIFAGAGATDAYKLPASQAMLLGQQGNSGRQFVKAGTLVDIPAAPGPYYDWDWTSMTWVPNVAAAKAAAKVAIEVDRDAAVFNPVIVYDNKNLDADAVSIDRLSKKIAALESYEAIGQTMPVQMLVWRDHDNITHAFATHAEYKQWLSGFAVALDLRGTQAFAVSWQKKSLLDAATTIQDVLAIEPTI